MNTRDIIKGDSIPVIGERYAIVLKPDPIVEDNEVVEGACDNSNDVIRLRDQFQGERQAATTLAHEALEALKGTLELEWLTHDRIYLLSSFMGGVIVDGVLGLREKP